jgi:SAM-dependent methyltransferase
LALDVGCGEGADAVWLAQRGWQVVATDISSVAIKRAAQHVRSSDPLAAARIEWRQVDLLVSAPEPDTFDLVSVQFMHLPPELRSRLFTSVAASVRPGGTLLVVGHHPSDLLTGVKRPSEPELLYTADDIAKLLDPSWTIVVSDSRPRFATTPEGVEATVHDAVLRAIRQSPPRSASSLD